MDDWMTDAHKAAALEGFLSNPIAVAYSQQRAADAQHYREGAQLTGAEVPNAILSKLDTVWLGASQWSTERAIHAPAVSDTVGMDVLLDQIEETLLLDAARGAVVRGHTLLTDTGPCWYRSTTDTHDDDEWVKTAQRVDREWIRRWNPDGPDTNTYLVARRSGMSIPLLTEEI